MRCRSDRRTSMPWRKVCFSKRDSLYCSCLMCFFTTFFYTLRLLGVFFRQPQGLSTSSGAGQHTLRLLAQHTRLSTFPEPCCWPSVFKAAGCQPPTESHRWGEIDSCTERGPGGSQTCHRDLDAWPCHGTHPLSGYQGESCQCPC